MFDLLKVKFDRVQKNIKSKDHWKYPYENLNRSKVDEDTTFNSKK